MSIFVINTGVCSQYLYLLEQQFVQVGVGPVNPYAAIALSPGRRAVCCLHLCVSYQMPRFSCAPKLLRSDSTTYSVLFFAMFDHL